MQKYNSKQMGVFALVAEWAHEANRSYCQSIGDNSQVRWADAPEWQRVSAIKGVIFHYETPDATPQDSHESWLREKEADGWSYGPEKDPINKRHPCYVPYKELPEEQKAKDLIFLHVVRAGLRVTREELL